MEVERRLGRVNVNNRCAGEGTRHVAITTNLLANQTGRIDLYLNTRSQPNYLLRQYNKIQKKIEASLKSKPVTASNQSRFLNYVFL